MTAPLPGLEPYHCPDEPAKWQNRRVKADIKLVEARTTHQTTPSINASIEALDGEELKTPHEWFMEYLRSRFMPESAPMYGRGHLRRL